MDLYTPNLLILKNFVYLLMVVLGLHCCTQAFFLFGGNHKTQLDKKASVSGELYHVHRLENNIIKRSALPS